MNSKPSHRLRPVRETDLPALLELVSCLNDSLTSLPNDKVALLDRIHASLRGFHPHISKPNGENYWFVLEVPATGKIIGCSGLLACVGGFEPFYTYEIRTETSCHKPLGIERSFDVLHLKKNHRGPAEACSLFLHPSERRGGLGRLLSLGRFHFIAQFPERFESEIIAELRGYVDTDGEAPFWSAVGQRFFERSFREADFLSGLGEKTFIRDLMPRHPIYTELLPATARDAIGRIHPETIGAYRLLEAEGFRRSAEVDIFDAGPILSAVVNEVRTVRTIRQVMVMEGAESEETPQPPNYLISNRKLDFRAATVHLPEQTGEVVTLAPQLLADLELAAGDTVSISPLYPPRPA